MRPSFHVHINDVSELAHEAVDRSDFIEIPAVGSSLGVNRLECDLVEIDELLDRHLSWSRGVHLLFQGAAALGGS